VGPLSATGSRTYMATSNGEVEGPRVGVSRAHVDRSPQVPARAAGRATRAQIIDGARGALLQARHGPLQRLLEVARTVACGAVIAAVLALSLYPDRKSRRPYLITAWAAHTIPAHEVDNIDHASYPGKQAEWKDYSNPNGRGQIRTCPEDESKESRDPDHH